VIRYHDVRQLTTAELERTKRDLYANLGLITPDSPAHVPIHAHLTAIDAELVERARNQKVNGSAVVLAGIQPADCDSLTALSNEYAADWEVSKPGLYVADHRRLAVSLFSDSISGLAEKLRAFTELVNDLP